MASIAGDQPPPGWYPDPTGADGARWWDGRAWTPNFAPNPPARPGLHPGGPGLYPVPGGAPESDPGPRPLPARAAWLALPAILVGFVLGGILQVLGGLVFPGSTAAQILLSEIGLWCGLGGTCLVASHRFGTGSLERDFGWRFRVVDLGYGLLAFVVCIFTAGFIGSAFHGTRFAGSNTNIITSQKGNTVGVAVVTVIASVGAPIFEELFFRGFLRLSLASRLGVGAVWVQAVFFGMAHFQFSLGVRNVSIMAATAGLGVVLGYTAHLTRRLGAGTTAHGLFNLIVTLVSIGAIK